MAASVVLSPDTIVHRIGGGEIERLRLRPAEVKLKPPGISVLIGGTSKEAADLVRSVLAPEADLYKAANRVGSTTVEAIRQAGFDVIQAETKRLPNHGRLIHPLGAAGFTDANLAALALVFQDTVGC